MKKRQYLVLQHIIDCPNISLSALQKHFEISKRTLYYDIENINYHLERFGAIRNFSGGLRFIGDVEIVKRELSFPEFTVTMGHEERQKTILYRLLLDDTWTLEKFAAEYNVSRNTIVSDIDSLKTYCERDSVHLFYDGHYRIEGDELKIRELFLQCMEEDNNIFNIRNEAVIQFNEIYDLHLTDYSISFLSQFIQFIKGRLRYGNTLTTFNLEEDVTFKQGVIMLIPQASAVEIQYLSAYILSLQASLTSATSIALITSYVDRLVAEFEIQTATMIQDQEPFKQNLRRHILSSYYRIKYRFPAVNPHLNLIRTQYRVLFQTLKNIIENDSLLVFKDMRDEEIAYITSYFGGTLHSQNLDAAIKNRVVLVCPHGLMISKQLEIQIQKNIPNIQILACLSLQELEDYNETYDYIISTIPLEGYKRVIVVNPLLTATDIQVLMQKTNNLFSDISDITIQSLLEAVSRHGNIADMDKLRDEFLRILFDIKRKEPNYPMLKDLLTAERIQHVTAVTSWEAAIALASKPLLEDGSIEPAYIDAMIQSVEDNGPYIVLNDYFALPHASGGHYVHKVAMALLTLDEAVDLKGKPVKMFLVLAPIDSTTHMNALAALTELLMDDAAMTLFMKGSKAEILERIAQSGGEAL